MKASCAVLGALLGKQAEGERDSLLGYASLDLQELLGTLPLRLHGDPLEEGEPSHTHLFAKVHESWIAPLLRPLPEEEVRLFLSALPPEKRAHLRRELGIMEREEAPKKLARLYASLELEKRLGLQDLLPPASLPETPLSPLCEMSQEALLTTIDFLGLHDLAGEMRELIDAAKLRRLYAALSPLETEFVKKRLFEPERVLFKRMQLKEWEGDPKKLKLLIQRRGINRLGKALYGQEPSLLFYVTRTLDDTMGKLLERSATPLEHARATEVLKGEVAHLLSLFKTGAPPYGKTA